MLTDPLEIAVASYGVEPLVGVRRNNAMEIWVQEFPSFEVLPYSFHRVLQICAEKLSRDLTLAASAFLVVAVLGVRFPLLAQLLVHLVTGLLQVEDEVARDPVTPSTEDIDAVCVSACPPDFASLG